MKVLGWNIELHPLQHVLNLKDYFYSLRFKIYNRLLFITYINKVNRLICKNGNELSNRLIPILCVQDRSKCLKSNSMGLGVSIYGKIRF